MRIEAGSMGGFGRHSVLMIFGGTLFFALVYLGIGSLSQKQLFLPLMDSFFSSKNLDDREIREAITLYNKVLTDLYVSDGQTLRLDDLPAGTGLRHELYRELDFLRSRNLVLIYDMASLKFVSIRQLSPFAAEATTFEEWNYVYRKGAARAQASGVKGTGGGFRYSLVRLRKGWTITGVTPVKIKAPGRDEFKY